MTTTSLRILAPVVVGVKAFKTQERTNCRVYQPFVFVVSCFFVPSFLVLLLLLLIPNWRCPSTSSEQRFQFDLPLILTTFFWTLVGTWVDFGADWSRRSFACGNVRPSCGGLIFFFGRSKYEVDPSRKTQQKWVQSIASFLSYFSISFWQLFPRAIPSQISIAVGW